METQQTTTTQPPVVLQLSWREKFAGLLVLLIGIIYLLWQVIDFISSKSGGYAVKEGALQVSTSELFNHIRSIVSILLAFMGGWLLLKGKRAGWVIGVALLFLLNVIAAGIMIASYAAVDNLNKIVGGVLVLPLLLALIFLLLPSARLKYKVGRNTLVTTVALIILLIGLYFFLQ